MLITFCRGNSFFHSLSPTAKLFWALIITFLSTNCYFAIQQITLLAIVICFIRFGSDIHLAKLFGLTKFFLSLVLTLFIAQLIVTPGETHVWPSTYLHFLTIESLNHAGNIAVRMAVLIGVAVAFVTTTDPSDLGHALNQQMKLPYTFTVLFFMTLRMIKIFENELKDLIEANQLRNWGQNETFLKKLQEWKLFSKLLIMRGFRKSMLISISMQSRGLENPNRTSISLVRFTSGDWIFLGATILGSVIWFLVL